MTGKREIRLNAFDMNCVGHIQHGLWRHPRDKSANYTDLDYWMGLARTLEHTVITTFGTSFATAMVEFQREDLTVYSEFLRFNQEFGRIEADGRNDPLEEALLAFLAEG